MELHFVNEKQGKKIFKQAHLNLENIFKLSQTVPDLIKNGFKQ